MFGHGCTPEVSDRIVHKKSIDYFIFAIYSACSLGLVRWIPSSTERKIWPLVGILISIQALLYFQCCKRVFQTSENCNKIFVELLKVFDETLFLYFSFI